MPSSLPYRLIAVDIDGTLVNSSGQISPATREAIQNACRMGIQVLLATGRRYLTARSVAVQLEAEVLIAAHNGALLKALDGTAIHSLQLPESVAQRAAEVLLHLGYDPLVFQGTQDAAWIWIDRTLERNAEGWMQRYLERNAPYLRIADSLPQAPFGKALEVVGVIPRDKLEATMDALEQTLGDRARLICQIPRGDTRAFLEIAHPEVSKATPLRFLAERMHCDRSQIVAFGDNYNDLDMLEYAGLAFLMANAPDDLKERGYRLTRSNDEDGVAHAINELLKHA